MTKNRITAYLMLLAVAAIWGAASPVIKFTLDYFPPLLFLIYRFLITCLILLPIFAILDDKLPEVSKRNIIMILLAGLFGTTFNLGLLFWGIDNTTALAAAVITATSPVFVVISGHLFLREKVSGQEIMGLVVAFAGSLIVTLSPSVEKDGQTLFGNALIFGSIFAWLGYVILTKRELKDKASPLFLTTSSFLVGLVSLLPFGIFRYGSVADMTDMITSAPPQAHLGVLYMSILSGALAYWLYQEGQKRIEASEATIFIYLLPVFAAPLAIFWLGEEITLPFLLGAGTIIIGVVIAEWKKRRQH